MVSRTRRLRRFQVLADAAQRSHRSAFEAAQARVAAGFVHAAGTGVVRARAKLPHAFTHDEARDPFGRGGLVERRRLCVEPHRASAESGKRVDLERAIARARLDYARFY